MNSTTSISTTNNYWNMLKHLSDDVKIDLITLLSSSLKEKTKKSIPASRFYGIWGDDGMTDEEFVNELKSLRNFKKDIIDL
ncbi:MAG: hypothetical protein IJV09_01015 [Prevotella sp.]|nr:hypothetical protein [Prevotella sp.]